MSIKRVLKSSFSTCVIALLILSPLSPLSILKPAVAQEQPTGTVLRQIYVPVVITMGSSYPTIGLAFDGSSFYYSAGFDGDTRIINVDENGNLLRIIQTTPAVPIGGLAWDGSQLWGGVINSIPGWQGCYAVYTIIPTTNQTTEQFRTCSLAQSFPGIDGLAYDTSTNTLWLGFNYGRTVYQLSRTGEVLRTINTGFPETSGVEFDGKYVWVMDPANHALHQFTMDGVEVFSFAAANMFHEDLAFDSLTFAPKCALWSMEAYAPTVDPRTGMPANRITATEIPCPYGSARKVSIIAGPGGSVSYRFAGGSGTIQGGTFQAVSSVLDDPISLAATPGSGSVFSAWSTTTGVDTTFNNQPLDLNSPNITPVITGNGIIIAKFSSKPASTNLLLNVNSSVITESSSSKITATVLDQYGMPIPGVSVDFASTIGTLSSPSSLTDALGHASVTLAPIGSISTAVSAVVSASANGLTAIQTITFVRQTSSADCNTSQSWKSCGGFKITSDSITIPQAVKNLPIIGGIGNALLNPALDDYPIRFYALAPSCSTDTCETSFTHNLQSLWGISVPSDYRATEVMMLEIPLISILDNAGLCYRGEAFGYSYSIGCLNIPATNNGVPWSWGFKTTAVGITPYVQFTPSGNLNLALTLSRNTKTASSIDIVKLVSKVASLLIAVFKTDPKSKADALANALSSVASILAQAADSFDMKLSVITSDMSKVGFLSSYDVFDFDDFATAVSNTLDAAATAIGIASREHLLKVAMDAAIAAGHGITGNIPVALKDAAEAAIDTFNYVLQWVVSQPPLSDNWVAQGIATAVGIVVSIIDPNGSTIVPSYYDSRGRLVLGYNVTSGTAVFTSSSGVLLASNDTYYAYVFGGGNVTVRMNTVGTAGVLVPYVLEASNMTLGSAQTTYAGLIEVGSPLDVGLNRAQDGSIMPQLSVVPSVEVLGNRVLAIPFLTNGTKVAAKSAVVFIGSQAYKMIEENATLFSLDLSPGLGGSILLVYVVVSGFAGGYTTSYFPQVNPVPPGPFAWWQQYWYVIVAGVAVSIILLVSMWTVRRRKPIDRLSY